MEKLCLQQELVNDCEIKILNQDTIQTLPIGSSFLNLDKSIPFGCRAAACGMCQIEVISGSENLNPETDKEIRAKNILGKNEKNLRLACQVKVFGDVTLKIKNSRSK